MSDYRDVAGHYRPVLQDVDLRAMTATFTTETDEGEEVEHTVYLKFELCHLCEGRGSHVNPSIDSHGLSREDFDDDPDFAEDYMQGAYDVPCSICHGRRVEAVVDEHATKPEIVAAYQEQEQAAWDYARETTHARDMGY
jgi:predicted methyltransferase